MSSEEVALVPETTEPRRFCPLRELTPGKPVSGVLLIAVHPFRSEMALAGPELALKTGDWVVIRDTSGEDIGRVMAHVETETVAATVLGLFPLALSGGPLWAPLCYAQIGGLTVASLLTVFLAGAVLSAVLYG